MIKFSNITIEEEKDELVIRVKKGVDLGKSKSGKSELIF